MQMQQMKGEQQRVFSEVAPAGKYPAYIDFLLLC